jgi:hypothetical protein
MPEELLFLIAGGFLFAMGLCRVFLAPINPIILDHKKSFTLVKVLPSVKREAKRYFLAKVINILFGLIFLSFGILLILGTFHRIQMLAQ